MMKLRRVLYFLIVSVLVLMLASVVMAQSPTSKSLSTSATYLNFSQTSASVQASYVLEGGSSWGNVPAGYTSFTLAGNGGQAIHRHYGSFAGSMNSGSGSVVVQSDQPFGAVVQILAVGQTATSGAYSGISAGSQKFNLPLVIRQLNSADGLVNSQLVIQNVGSAATDISVEFINSTGASVFTKNFTAVPAGASQYYSLNAESSSNLPDGFFGSAVVSAANGGSVGVVVSQFAGANQLQTYNAFAQENTGTTWYIPLFTSRLANSLSTPVSVQNLSGGSLNAGDIKLECTPDAASTGSSAFTVSNPAAVVNNGATFFNPVTDTSIPANWFGSCKLTSTGNVVAFVQLRTPSAPDNASAYEAINASGTATTLQVPLVAKRLGNGFATALTVQNLNASTAATVNITYVPSADYIASGGSSSNVTKNSVSIAAGSSLIENHRTTSGVAELPEGWFGTVTITSDQPLGGFVQLTNVNVPAGDTSMAHNAFAQ
jgi:hypothetical protein